MNQPIRFRRRPSIPATACVAGILILVSGAPVLSEPPPGKKSWSVGILVMDGVYNTELVGPFDIFSHADPFRVFTVAPERREIVTAEGIRLVPDHGFADHPAIDILVIPSFEDYKDHIGRKPLIGWIRERAMGADWVLSHCWGAFYLAAAGLLDGHLAMTYPPDIDELAEKFPEVRTRKGYRFVRDGKFITSAGGVASYESPLFLVRKLAGDEWAARVARGLVIEDWRQETIKYLDK